MRPWNEEARTVYERWGFRESKLTLAAKAEDLEATPLEDGPAPSHGLVFAQTDDESHVPRPSMPTCHAWAARIARTSIRRRTAGSRSTTSCAAATRALLRRLAQELSYRTGGVVLTLGVEEEAVVRYVLFDRGSIADEYCSLPEYHGPLPPGDVVALNANPTVAHRLTGADASAPTSRGKTASSAADLPAAEELYAELAAVLGVPIP